MSMPSISDLFGWASAGVSNAMGYDQAAMLYAGSNSPTGDLARSSLNGLSSGGVKPFPSSAVDSSRSSSGYYAPTPQPTEWANADLATLYGMDKHTAYQEALANTAHQREVKDLIAAGLNPVLSASGGNGAAVFGASSGGSGGSGGSGSSTEDNSLFGTLGMVAGLIGAIALKNPKAVAPLVTSGKTLGESVGKLLN